MAASGDDKSLSYFQKTVCLDEWWLIRAETEIEGKRLAVSGFTPREDQAVRAFSSAPVLKRYDIFTLETTDGICVILKGFINKARTLENGFPSEVFRHFLFGFPPHWEACAEKFLGQEFATDDVSKVHASTIDSSDVTKENYEKAITEKTVGLSASVANPELDQDRGDIMIQEGSKKSNKSVRYSSRVGVAENKGRKKIAGAEKESTLKEACPEKFLGQGFATKVVSKEIKDHKKIAGTEKENTLKEASTAVKKTKRKLTYESPVTPRGEDLAFVVSPESLSCKRSRSGRLLLPALEYWRNQTAIYDADHRIIGIKEGINTPSRGIKSEPQRKRTKHT